MKKKLLIFHPGMPKTATTYLQKFFLNLNEINLLYHQENHNTFWKINHNLFNDYTCQLTKSKKKIFLQKCVEEFKKINSNKNIFLYSYEGIFNPYRFNIKENTRNFYYLINNLKKKFRIKIFFTIREQNDLIRSWYISGYDILKNKYKNADHFLEKEMSKKRLNKFLDYNFLNDEIVKKTNIQPKYLIYEDLKKNKTKYQNELSKILEIETVKLPTNKINVTKKNKNKESLVVDNEIYYFFLKINLKLNKIKYFHFLTKNFKKSVKNLLNIKKINFNNSRNNFFDNSNKIFFKKINKKNNIFNC